MARPPEEAFLPVSARAAETFTASASSSPTDYGVSANLPAGESLPYTRAHARGDEEDDSQILERIAWQGQSCPEGFPDYAWPEFLTQGMRCGETVAQRDILFLAELAVYDQMMSPTLHFHYSHRTYHPCMQMFVMAPPASGKGVLGWVRHLGMPIHEQLIDEYRRASSPRANAAYIVSPTIPIYNVLARIRMRV